ncbi:Nop domain [Arabidopsis suecica]|uniref:Nop domain n=1 Tax=Arabidopsis suecica TaxID=45249 RepID=A0A8T2BAK4_ARASU|nr:Nop domain [Arabidopsis suecica]
MATLEDSFYADLDELSDNEAELDARTEEEEDNIDMDMEDSETLNYDDLSRVSKLLETHRYADIMHKLEQALGKDSDGGAEMGTVLEDKLIVDCNQLSADIENEIVIFHNFIRDKYRLKFPELESLVHDPIDYARVVKKIANETDITLVDMEGLLQPATVIAVSVTALTTKGKPLPDSILRKTLDACDHAIVLDSARKKVLEFVESKMGSIAPNLAAIVGSAVAAKLMGTAGGLSALANMPACNVLVLGHNRKNRVGFSTALSQSRAGYLEQTEIFQSTPPELRMRASRLLASKSTLAARVDATRGDPSGTNGKALREEIRKNIDKWQEPPPARQPKPLHVPYSEPKKRRGGRRLRKMKERYRVTDMRKLANRMAFGTPEDSSLGDGLGIGYGMLGQAGSNRLRVSSKLKVNAKVAKKRQFTGGSTTSGLTTSSLAFTLVQGIELCNPQALGLVSGIQSTYFSESGTFSKLKKI